MRRWLAFFRPRLRIVVRQSPDWRNAAYADLIEASRAYCRLIPPALGIAENFIADVVEIWDRTFRMSFFNVRAAMKDIAQQNLAAVRRATVSSIDTTERGKLAQSAFYLFVDDDDWLHPDVGHALDAFDYATTDGCVFGNVLCVGRIQTRSLEDGCYTNNYAVSGRFLRQRDDNLDRVFQHVDANRVFHQPGFRFTQMPAYLSATNKHPATSMKLNDGAKENGLSAAALRRQVERFVDESANPVVPAEAAWVVPYTRRTRDVFAAIL